MKEFEKFTFPIIRKSAQKLMKSAQKIMPEQLIGSQEDTAQMFADVFRHLTEVHQAWIDAGKPKCSKKDCWCQDVEN